jgi:hypothetical protein
MVLVGIRTLVLRICRQIDQALSNIFKDYKKLSNIGHIYINGYENDMIIGMEVDMRMILFSLYRNL